MRLQRFLVIVSVILLTLTFCTGCAEIAKFVDTLLGVTQDPITNLPTPPAPGTSIAGVVAGVFGGPVGTGAVGLLTTLWAYIRGRQWKKVATVSVMCLAKIRAAMEDGKITEEEMLDICRDEQDGAGVREFVVSLMRQQEALLAKQRPVITAGQA